MPVESDENPSDTSCADAECSVVDDHEHKKTNSEGSSLRPSAAILAWKEVVVRTHFTEKETIEEKFSRLLEGEGFPEIRDAALMLKNAIIRGDLKTSYKEAWSVFGANACKTW